MSSDLNEKFVRDKSNPGAIINTDTDALIAYKRQKLKNKEIDIIKADVLELKLMMQLLLEKLNK